MICRVVRSPLRPDTVEIKEDTMRSKSRPSQKKRRKNTKHDYGTLEDRNLLATLIEVNPGNGHLTINMNANDDVAVVGIADNGNVTVNGNQDLNTAAAGVQTLPADNMTRVAIDGDPARTGQTVAFNADFTGQRELQSVEVTDVNQISINNQLTVITDLDVRLSGTNGRIGDATDGRVIVGGTTTIDAGANAIGLNNANNNFNRLNVTTTGANKDAVITDINGVTLTGVRTSGDLVLTTGGFLQDAPNTTIEVLGDAHLTASGIYLGDNAGDSTNFHRSSYHSAGHVEVQEDSNTILVSSDVGSLTLYSDGGIYDGIRTTINVDGRAQFFGNNRVRIGEGGQDTFNAGSVEFRSNGHVHITENSDTLVTGENRGKSINLRSWGHLSDSEGTSINVRNQTGLEGISVVLGDSPTDVFNTGSMYFYTTELFSVTEDSNSHIIETKNRAGDLFLESAGTITNAKNAQVKVDNLAEFKAVSVNIGATQEDVFNAGEVKFETKGRFKLSENSDLKIVGDSSAATSVINSKGDITNEAGAKVNIRSNAAFFADNIVLGNRSGDEFNAGTIAFRTPDNAAGLVLINEDSGTNLGGFSEAKSLKLQANGDITDGPNSNVDIAGNSQLKTLNNGRVMLGESGTLPDSTPYDSVFASLSLTVQTDGSGNATIQNDGDIVLAGVNRANSLSLIADGGTGKILDAAESQIDVTYNLNVEGSLINLGTAIIENGSSTDRLEFKSLTFKSSGNVNVSADDSFFLTGASSSGGFLTLESEGDIRSTGGSELVSQAGAKFDGMDILVGNLDTDCFEIIDTNSDGSKRLSVNGQGTEDVQLGCNA